MADWRRAGGVCLTGVQGPAGHHRHLAAMAGDEILGKLGQELARGRLIGPVRPIEEGNVHQAGTAREGAGEPDLLGYIEARYQSIVRRSPSRKSVDALNPNASDARLTSRLRRGCPSGLEGSKTRRPRNPERSAM